ncbi:MAG: hypothetical protein GAK43_01152 [Stenotrophomonas maltophilia]|nr:MAG: hypothetical protein GAK43_01152 [Stenotrophomonas maltophilia]
MAPHAARHSADVEERPSPTPASPEKPAINVAPQPPVASPAVVAASAKVEASKPQAQEEPLWIHDDLDLDSLNLDEELAKLDEYELSQEFLSLKSAPRPAEALLGKREEARDPHDERWAEALLAEHATPRGVRQEPRLSKASVNVEPEPERRPLIDEADDEPPLPTLSARRDEEATEDDAEDESPAISREPALGRLAADHDDDEAPAAHENRPEPALREHHLHELSDEPLQLDWQKPRSRWGRQVLWSVLLLAALGGLGAQYVIYHFDELAREDAYRPWFAEYCPTFGCTLPSRVDVDQIRSSNLVVRSHPDFNGALVVDAIIYNRAIFTQPFPLLELRFADLNGQLIASRSFKPSEYLGGELAGKDDMPPQVPIHISLDILDPGSKAVNYSLSFHSPE